MTNKTVTTGAYTYTEAMRLDANGNAGIGLSVPAPSYTIVMRGPQGDDVGKFDFSSGTLEFEGNATEAAQVFIAQCRSLMDVVVMREKRALLQEVKDAILHEASGELYDDAEKLAMLVCMHRVQEIVAKRTHGAPLP